MKHNFGSAALLAFALGTLHAQTVDNSGNGLLKGAFRFRQVAVLNYDQNANPTQMRSAYGVITFDGNGNYSVTGTYVDNTVSNGAPQTLTVTSTYAIGSNGLGYMQNPLLPTDNSSRIYGAVAQGVFSGSASESAFNDILVAIPSGTPPANSSFNVPYWTGVLDFAGASSTAIKNALFKLSPNGQGSFGTITFQGQASNQSAASLTQTTTGATYSFQSDGSANLNFPLPSGVSTANALVAGARTMFMSADGNFILGYTPTGYDVFVGVKAPTSAPAGNPCKCLFFWSGLEDDPTGQGLGMVGFEAGIGIGSYWGSLYSYGDSTGDAVQHARLNIAAFYNGTDDAPFDFGSDNQITVNSDGTSMVDFNGYQYAFASGGQSFVGIGTSGIFTILVGLASPPTPSSSPTSVYLNPIGVFNAASYAPVTSPLAPGETVSLFGSNLSNVTMSAPGGQPAPTNLGGVQVTVNGIATPLYYVSPGQINMVVPFGTSGQLATIQVINSGTKSNTVTLYTSDSAPGVFTQTSNGLGYGAALHADYTLITASHPAQPGETIQVYLTGLGSVTPAVADGALGPTNPLSNANVWTSTNLTVYFNDYTNSVFFKQATIQYAGLAPGLLGYQLNVTIPAGIGPSTNPGVYMEILTDLADVNQVQIPVGGASSAAAEHARPRAVPRRPQLRPGAQRPAPTR
jgi:uncharacterized protein (TIGR03437 family)